MKALSKKPKLLPMSTTGSFHQQLIHAADDQTSLKCIARQSDTGISAPQVYPQRLCLCATKCNLNASAIPSPLKPNAEVSFNPMHASANDRKPPARQQDVLHFEISVVDALGMAVRKAIQQLCK